MVSIAIDGPAGAGKSTVAKILAKKLGFLYFDTGALYRVLGYYFVENNIDYENESLVVENLKKIKISFSFRNNKQLMFLNGEDVTSKIRNNKISMTASAISAIPAVRNFLLETQRDFARKNNVVMDGRDIGTVVLPNAYIKIFLTASVKVRAGRRYGQLRRNDPNVRYNDVLKMVIKRDSNDTNRKISPLKPASGAIILDTSNFKLSQTIGRLLNIVRKKIDGKKQIYVQNNKNNYKSGN